MKSILSGHQLLFSDAVSAIPVGTRVDHIIREKYNRPRVSFYRELGQTGVKCGSYPDQFRHEDKNGRMLQLGTKT